MVPAGDGEAPGKDAGVDEMIPSIHNAPLDRVTVEFDANNETNLRKHLARGMPYFRVRSLGWYREYMGRVTGESKGKTADNLQIMMGNLTVHLEDEEGWTEAIPGVGMFRGSNMGREFPRPQCHREATGDPIL